MCSTLAITCVSHRNHTADPHRCSRFRAGQSRARGVSPGMAVCQCHRWANGTDAENPSASPHTMSPRHLSHGLWAAPPWAARPRRDHRRWRAPGRGAGVSAPAAGGDGGKGGSRSRHGTGSSTRAGVSLAKPVGRRVGSGMEDGAQVAQRGEDRDGAPLTARGARGARA